MLHVLGHEVDVSRTGGVRARKCCVVAAWADWGEVLGLVIGRSARGGGGVEEFWVALGAKGQPGGDDTSSGWAVMGVEAADGTAQIGLPTD